MVITHLHPDHCVDLMGLEVHMVWGPGAGSPPLPVIGPPGLRERAHRLLRRERVRHRVHVVERSPPGARARCGLGGGLVMRHREVPHLPPTNAVRFERDGAAVCLGADCAYGDALPELAAGCDVLVCEATFGAGPGVAGVPHMTAAEAGRIAARAGVGRLLLTHLDPARDAEAALAHARAEFAGPGGPGAPRAGGDAVTAGGMKPRPTDRRSVVIATLLSLLLPGLGHAYALRLPRALVWFAGTIVVGDRARPGRARTRRWRSRWGSSSPCSRPSTSPSSCGSTAGRGRRGDAGPGRDPGARPLDCRNAARSDHFRMTWDAFARAGAGAAQGEEELRMLWRRYKDTGDRRRATA